MSNAEPPASPLAADPDQPLDLFLQPPPRALGATPVAPGFAFYRVISLTLRWLALLVVALVAWLGEPELSAGVPVALFLLAGLHLLLAWHEARRRCWGVRSHDLTHTAGLLVRRTTLLPLNRIQHVETLSGPLERWFGLERVVCYTAGGLSADLVMAGLPTETANRLREFLLDQVSRQTDEEEDAVGAGT